jgi:glycosyltransferase involved in cell wall biosynthesis
MTTYGVLSTYPPTQCGLATFSSALAQHLRRAGEEVAAVSVVDAYRRGAPPEVRYQWVRGRAEQVAPVAAVLDATDVVVVQHEFGIFGGSDGREVLDVVRRLRTPVIVVLHTVLVSPSPGQRAIVEELAARARAVVTMTKAARDRLLRTCVVDAARVHVVPHGADDNRPTRDEPRADRTSSFRMLSWGLIGPGKGIEWAIDAMAALMDLDVEYHVVGQTHPKVVEQSGEAYRSVLVERAHAAGLSDRVRFDDRYLTTMDLNRIVRSADVVLLPYESREQVTSGVLVEAVAAVRPVVSTDFPHARELLGGGAGLLVPPRDPVAIAAAVRRLVTEPGLTGAMTNHSAQLAPNLWWPSVAAQYRRLAAEVRDRTSLAS